MHRGKFSRATCLTAVKGFAYFNCNQLLSDCLLSVVCKWTGLYGRQFIQLISCDAQALQNREKNVTLCNLLMVKSLHWPLLTEHSNLFCSWATGVSRWCLSAFLLLGWLSLLLLLSAWWDSSLLLLSGRGWEIGSSDSSHCRSLSWEVMQRWQVTNLFPFWSVKH